MVAGGVIGGEYVAVGVVFHLNTVGIQPVVENLAAQDVTADTPEVLPTLPFQVLGALADGV